MTETLLRDLIAIPERVHKGDFVLKLTEGVAHGDETVREYVVTEPLAKNFDQALGLIRSAVENRTSKAAYLHGSFGSGKSHFMAMLHLLLQHDAGARAVPELAGVVSTHSGWLQGKRFLLVPYHMIGARSFEQALVDGYLRTIEVKHPDAQSPAVFRAEALFKDAAGLRSTLGDAAFFAKLNARAAASSASKAGGWGALDQGWDVATYAAAVSAGPHADERRRLTRDLVSQFFPSYAKASGDDSYLDMDDVLLELSRHAKSLGYDALILFLDELILWLASHVADSAFIGREAQKVAKFVESGTTMRACAVISFIARQRDLRELIGEHVPGAEKLGFTDVLDYARGRFDTIKLEDRNLAAIVEKRLLKPKDAAAREAIDRAFERVEKVRDTVLTALLTRDGDRATFRRVYPFSPALVQVLVAVSSALQRERTALRVMLQLLVDQRDRLELGQLVAVGDLFDVIAEGDEPFTDQLRSQFENTKKLWRTKLLPMLEDLHGIRYEAARIAPADDAKARAFRGDERLLKTLLLAALVPEEESLKNLTAGRLHALNHGTIVTPVAGRETQAVLAKMREFASRVGEIKIGEGSDPTLAVQVTGVDIEPILERAASEDTKADRLRRIRDTIYKRVGVSPGELFNASFPWEWRGTARTVDVVFGNVRELSTDAFRVDGDRWKIVIDYPFDEMGHSAQDDISRIDDLRGHEVRDRTVCWIPSFFSNEMLTDLGRLVRAERILTGERFRTFTEALSDVDRQAAKLLLENLRSQLDNKLLVAIEAAYGLREPPPRLLDEPLDPTLHLHVLCPGVSLRPPVGADLKSAFLQLLDQLMSWQYSAHPEFKRLVKTSELKKILEVAHATNADPQHRSTPEASFRPILRDIAGPLGLGEQHEAAFLLSDQWRTKLLKKAAADEGSLTVRKLREFIDDPKPMGLPREVQNLLILVFAEQTGKALVGLRADGASIEQIDDDLELRDQKLPSQSAWKAARDRAAKLFGIALGRDFVSAHNVASLAAELGEKARQHREDANLLLPELKKRSELLGWNQSSARLKTAAEALRVVEQLLDSPDSDRLDALAGFSFAVPLESIGTSLSRAGSVRAVLKEPNSWDFVDLVRGLEDGRHDQAMKAIESLRSAFEGDEYVLPLEGAFREFTRVAMGLVKQAVRHPDPPVIEKGPIPPPQQGLAGRILEKGAKQGLSLSEAEELFRRLTRALGEGQSKLDIEWTVRERAVEKAKDRPGEKGQ